MINSKTIAVVVPAFNEETQIEMVIKGIPEFVDRIIVVNDCSTDRTAEIVKEIIKNDTNSYFNIKIYRETVQRNMYNEVDFILYQNSKAELDFFIPSEVFNKDPENSRVILINNLYNGGVGASIARGYKYAKDYNIDCTAVIAGDGQMDPSELQAICEPIIFDGIDYVKGNRLIHRGARFVIPKKRYLGNSVLSLLTKVASGYWRISDTQTGYTAISLTALRSIEIHKIYKSYGMPNDLLMKLNLAYCTIREIPIKPVYHIGERSKMKIYKVIPKISLLLISNFIKRIWIKYFFRDFHPLFILYHISIILFVASIPFAINILKYLMGQVVGDKPILNSLMFSFLFINSFQSLLFAMWMDIQDNERLYK